MSDYQSIQNTILSNTVYALCERINENNPDSLSDTENEILNTASIANYIGYITLSKKALKALNRTIKKYTNENK